MAGSLSSAARSNSGAPAAAGHLPVRVMRLHEAGPEQSLAVLEPVSEHAELRRALMTRDTAPSIEHSRAQLLPRALRSPRGCLEHIRDGVAAALASAWELLYALRELLYYYAFGCIAYAHLEGWTVEESLYFLTVTATTVRTRPATAATRRCVANPPTRPAPMLHPFLTSRRTTTATSVPTLAPRASAAWRAWRGTCTPTGEHEDENGL